MTGRTASRVDGEPRVEPRLAPGGDLGEDPAVLLEDADLSLTEMGAFPVVVAFHLVVAFVTDPVLVPIVLGVAALAAVTAHLLTRDLFVVLAAAAVAPLYVTAVSPGLLSLFVGLALVATIVSRTPMVFPVVAGLGLLSPDAAWGAVAGVGAAAAVAAPAFHRAMPAWAGFPVAAAFVVLGGLSHGVWSVALVGAVAGALAFYAVRHPGLPVLARTIDRSAAWSAVLPALVLFLLATLGKTPTVTPVRMLLVAWGAVGLGVVTALSLLGASWMARATDHSVPVFLSFFPAFVIAIPLMVLATDLDAAGRSVAGLFVLFALPAALGARRLASLSGRYRGVLIAAMAILVVVASGLRLWLD